MDLTKLSDTELVEHSLTLLKTVKSAEDHTHELNAVRYEWSARGGVRRLAAYAEVGNQREAVRRKEAGL